MLNNKKYFLFTVKLKIKRQGTISLPWATTKVLLVDNRSSSVNTIDLSLVSILSESTKVNNLDKIINYLINIF